jgi:hypothetical protein
MILNMSLVFNGNAVFNPLPQPPTWWTWLPMFGNLLKTCPAIVATPAAILSLACKFFDASYPLQLAKFMTSTSGNCH